MHPVQVTRSTMQQPLDQRQGSSSRPSSKPPSRPGSRPTSRPSSATPTPSRSPSPVSTPRRSGGSCPVEKAKDPSHESRRDVFEALHEVLCNAGASGDEAGDREDNEDGEAAEGDGGKAVLACQTGPDWKKEMRELLTKRKGVMRLKAERPNTGEIGTWGVKTAAEDLVASRGMASMRVRCLLGRRGSMKSVAMALSKADDEATIDQQWAGLKTSFGHPYRCLVFHLTNHYALIFAWREWLADADPSGQKRLRRQILTSRRGQRPSAWMDFEEVRTILLGWNGYHVLELERLVKEELQVPPEFQPSTRSCPVVENVPA
ncbi:unnamed protein product [Polarella glacialis]|uniref:Uncharacterized protein n=1 Tax=Polarella glacialis TaxID=89957 RepID=A0A813G818_POLGL|nr:unnamed protein product [Polarella glacialis]CAE8693976.1 unnamed protein product [Polarella glacialis]